VVGALVEVMHAFTTGGRDILPLLCKLYIRMLLFEVNDHCSFLFVYKDNCFFVHIL